MLGRPAPGAVRLLRPDKFHDVAAFVQDGMADTADVFARSVWKNNPKICLKLGFSKQSRRGEVVNKLARLSVADEVAGRRLRRCGHVRRFRGGSAALRRRAGG